LPIQKKANTTGLPNELKSGIENLSGYSMDDVKVHYNSDKPAQLQAHAFAQGTSIHVASGQEKHLAHEAWHVVQQKQGRVKPTVQLKGIAVNDDTALENEADAMGSKALKNITARDPAAPQAIQRAVVQRKLLLDPAELTYSFEAGGDTDDYTFVGKFNGKNYYVKYNETDKLKSAADKIWAEILKKDFHPASKMNKIKNRQFDDNPDLAPGEEKYEEERKKETHSYLVGVMAPGKNFYKSMLEEGGDWQHLNVYHANTEDDDTATTMTAVSMKSLADEDYNLFEGFVQECMLNEGQPREKSEGGAMDRSTKATGKIYVKTGDKAKIKWDDEDNQYKDVGSDALVNEVADLSVEATKPGALHIKLGDIAGVYLTDEKSKTKKSKNLYINGIAYSKVDVAAKDPATIVTPFTVLSGKIPVKQETETYTRKSRGKGQANAMGKWSANAAVVASNNINGTHFDETIAYEWLHLRGAGLGGTTVAGNLTPGTWSANSEMIPIERKIKSLSSKPTVQNVKTIITPLDVTGVFAKQINIHISVKYRDVADRKSADWTVDAMRGTTYDKIHDKRLRQALRDEYNVEAVKDNFILYDRNGLMTGPVKLKSHLKKNMFVVELDDGHSVMAERDPDGRLYVDDINALDNDDD